MRWPTGVVALCLAACASSATAAPLPTLIRGGPGADFIRVGGAAARVLAGDGADTVIGGPQADDISGNNGADSIQGGGGNDTEHGGRGDDTLAGGPGDDWLAGDRGDDVLTGGPGRDHFVLALAGGHDRVTDFDGPGGDRIEAEGNDPLKILATTQGTVVRLADGSELLLSGIARAGLERWIVRPPAPPNRTIGLIAVVLACVAAFGWMIRRGFKRTPVPGPARGAPQLHDADAEQIGGDKAPPLEDLAPHAPNRNLGLDAMRAAAIGIVLIFHWIINILAALGMPAPPMSSFAGTLGVEIFFALSGFLIGRILIVQAGADPSLNNLGVFLVRRWMRTLPLYFVVLAVLLWLTPPPGPVLPVAARFATLSQNLVGPMPAGGFFSVSWTLTIEEWFYVLFGCAAFVSFRILRSDWAIWPPVLAFIVIPLGLRLYAPATPQVWLLLDQIAYGVGMAQLFRQGGWPFRHPAVSAVVGLALIAVACLSVTFLPAGLYAALVWNITILGCALLLPAALRLRSLPAKAHRLIGAVSAQSYSLYLIHLALLELGFRFWLNHLAPLWACLVFIVTTPFILSYLSFRFFESPILKYRPAHTATSRSRYKLALPA